MPSKVVMDLVQKGKQSVRVFQVARGFHDVKGHGHVKRGLEVATAGEHNVRTLPDIVFDRWVRFLRAKSGYNGAAFPDILSAGGQAFFKSFIEKRFSKKPLPPG